MKILSLVIITTLSGCSFAPNYQEPAMPVPSTLDRQADTKATVAVPTWESFFSDPEVKQLITLALDNNKDIKIAAGKVAEVKGRYQIQQSEIIPSVGLSGGGDHNSYNEYITRQYSAGVGITSYELDFWGRIRDLNAAALAQYLASIENAKSVRITVIAETANAYYNWITAKRTLSLSEMTLSSRKKNLNLMSMRQKAGISSDLDYTQADVAVASIEAQIAQAKQQLAIAHSNLELLVGKYDLDQILNKTDIAKSNEFNLNIPDNLSSEVLLGRPDVIAAEQGLRASNAQIGAARAAFFPKISFSSSIGFAGGELGSLFDSSSRAWSFAPSITIPLFGNGTKANLDVAQALKIQAVATYEKTIQGAFTEVYQYNISNKLLDEQLVANTRLVKTQKRRLYLSQTKYDAGLVSYFEVLSAQDSLFGAELQLLNNQNSKSQSSIYLYKALGGGIIPITTEKSD